jgi:outer membrane protein
MNNTLPRFTYFNIIISALFVFFLMQISPVLAQKKMSLNDVLELAQKNSPQAKIATTTFKNRFWSYQTFKTNYLPQLRFNATVPDLARSYSRITLNDGTDAFRLRTLSNSNASLSLTQAVGLTGGTIFLNSDLQRIDIFGNPKTISYLSTPVSIGIMQPVFGFNALKWDKRIEPLRYDEAKRIMNEELEGVSIRATELFFSLLVAQMDFLIQQKNVANNDTLYKISKGRYNLGKIAENDLLQMELNAMNASNNLAQAELDVELRTLQLKTFLNMKGDELITLIEPGDLPGVIIDEGKALAEAGANRSQILSFQRQKLEAERNVAEALGQRYGINIRGSYGLTQTGSDIASSYRSPFEQQNLAVQVNIPLVDWGRNRAMVETAKANRELTEATVTQAENSFKQDVVLAVRQVNMYRRKVALAAKADTVAQKRYDITVKRYLIGKIDITDLNIAIQEKDRARQDYFRALGDFWNSWLELRRKTLFDFEKNKSIAYETQP